jgi:RND family efflux transporter MFP subunit
MNPEEQKKTAQPEKPKRNIVKTVIIIAVIVLLAFAVKKYAFKPDAEQTAATPPPIPVPNVILHTVSYSNASAPSEYIGRVEPLKTVDLRAQVSGEISGVHFKEGSYVKAGQLLFTIDKRTYAAAVEASKADIARAEAALDKASKYHERLKTADKRSVSAAALDTAEGDVLQAKAAVAQAKAALEVANINLEHAGIKAPISGRIGKAHFTEGNIISPASGVLATIVSTNPARVAFAMPDKEYLNQLKVFKKSGGSVYKTTLKLSNGDTITAQGRRDFEDNKIDPATGTMTMRLLYDNRDGKLIPGSMVRLTLAPAQQDKRLAIPQESVIADFEGDYVFTVDSNGTANQKRVKLGAEFGGMREVTEGLAEGDKIIRQGIQMVRPGMKVRAIDPNERPQPAASADVKSADETAEQPGN